VLMDLQLPGIDGSEALRLLRRSGAPPMPVVAVTAFAMTEDRLRVERDGFDAYIEKPLRIRALPGQVRRLLGQEAPDDEP